MRDNEWLQKRLDSIWEMLFPEVEKKNKVNVYFKGRWKNKFGHIKRVGKDTEIVVNSLFQNEIIPENIVDVTLAHELIHYMHGFNSPHEQKYKHPHAGGIVTRELKNRGFGHMLTLERDFVEKQWFGIYKELNPKLYKKKSIGNRVWDFLKS
ncbi:MAG: hypothetical protein ABIJ18_01715 [archaeon]